MAKIKQRAKNMEQNHQQQHCLSKIMRHPFTDKIDNILENIFDDAEQVYKTANCFNI